MSPTLASDRFISALAATLDIPAERYESADKSYRSICTWLERSESRFSNVDIDAYIQGSFRLGTVIPPISGEEHYDLDVVFEFDLSKATKTQQGLYEDLGYELKLYAARYGMQAPSDWDRCWTLNYADTAQFHMDLLPSVPDGQRQRLIREQRAMTLDFVDRSISITDKNHGNYAHLSEDWPSSNPHGYADWFYECMKPAFDQKRRAMMLAEAKTDIADIPVFRVKTPLQSAIQILKRHRDMRFSDDPDGRPTSVVISTLAAHSYGQESSVTGALISILQSMDRYIVDREGVSWIENPSNPRENFADSWEQEPARKDAFYDWLDTARTDFVRAAEQGDLNTIIDALAPRMGRELVEKAASNPGQKLLSEASVIKRAKSAFQKLVDAPHRKPVAWPTVPVGYVQVEGAMARNGFRETVFHNDGVPLPRGSSLSFVANTDVPRPFKIYWQIVNTGEAAAKAKKLRGGFEQATVTTGTLIRREDASYAGSHTIECFVVKDGYCAARSGLFVVNIQ